MSRCTRFKTCTVPLFVPLPDPPWGESPHGGGLGVTHMSNIVINPDMGQGVPTKPKLETIMVTKLEAKLSNGETFAEMVPITTTASVDDTAVTVPTLVVHIRFNRLLSPEDLEHVKQICKTITMLTSVTQAEAVVISGRMPLWCVAFMTHELCHKVRTVAVFDPKLQCAVIVSTHDPKVSGHHVLKLAQNVTQMLTSEG